MAAHAVSSIPRQIRCAIYTRKSTEEGLEQDFNSLDAQRAAAEAYILSQRQEGWLALPHIYNDGGFTGANMDRPALDRLLQDIQAGRVDCVVVYKVDRLSRSLLDFARIMGTFEKHGISFVSVTQQFNTSVPVGRLTLNILLSFAQFEREIIGERTRDKKAAARKQGKWIGGYLPLGYDLDAGGGRLVVNEVEAQQVREIFDLFQKTRSFEATLKELHRRQWKRKSWVTAKGVQSGGTAWTEGTLIRLLSSELYTGWVVYQGKRYRGEHKPIISGRQWRTVQAIMHRRTRNARREPQQSGALLQGLLYCDACARPMRYTYTSRNEQRYRYYACLNGVQPCGSRVPAATLEASVLQQLESKGRLLPSAAVPSMVSAEATARIRSVVERVIYDSRTDQVSIQLGTKRGKQHGRA